MSRIRKRGVLFVLGALTLGLLTACNSTTTSTALTATITAPSGAQSITAGSTVTFSGSAVGGTAPYTYSWNFDSTGLGGGPTASTSQNPGAITFLTANAYVVKLTVTDSTSTTATATVTITVTAATGASAASDFTGAWVATCHPDGSGGNTPGSREEALSVTSTGTNTGSYTHIDYQWTNNDHCKGTPQVVQKETGTVTLYSTIASTSFGTGTQATINTTAQTTTVYDSSVASSYTSAGAYGTTSWTQGTPVSTLGKNYDGTAQATTQNQLFLVRNGVFFAFNGDSSASGSFPTTMRPQFVKVDNATLTASGLSAYTSKQWVGNCHVDQNQDFNATAWLERLDLDFSGASPVVTITDTYYSQDQTNSSSPSVWSVSACDTTDATHPAVVQAVEVQKMTVSFDSTATQLTNFGLATRGTATLGTAAYSHTITPSSYAVTTLNAANSGHGLYGTAASPVTWSLTMVDVTGKADSGSAAPTSVKIAGVLANNHFYVSGGDDATHSPLDSSGYPYYLDSTFLPRNNVTSLSGVDGTWWKPCRPSGSTDSAVYEFEVSSTAGTVKHTEYKYAGSTNCSPSATVTATPTTYTATPVSVTPTGSQIPPRGTYAAVDLTVTATSDSTVTVGSHVCLAMIRTRGRMYVYVKSPASTSCAATDFTSAYSTTAGLSQTYLGLETSPVTASTFANTSWKSGCQQDSGGGSDMRDYVQTFGSLTGLGFVANDQTFTYSTTDGTCNGSNSNGTVSHSADKTKVIAFSSTATTMPIGGVTTVVTNLDSLDYAFDQNGALSGTTAEKSAVKFLAHDFWVGANGSSTTYPTKMQVGAPFQRIQ